MPYMHKLACRLALLKDLAWTLPVLGLLACELPGRNIGPQTIGPLARLDIAPKSALIRINQTRDIAVVGFTAAGDTAAIAVSFVVRGTAGGALTGTSNPGRGRAIGHYRAGGGVGRDTVIVADTSGMADTSVVDVTPLAVSSVSVTPPSATLRVGGSSAFAATTRDSTGAVLTGRVITWASTAPSIASVDASGGAAGMGVGFASIIATSEGKSDTSVVTVTLVPVASVTVTPPAATILAGQTAAFSATTRDSAGTILNGRVITWISTAPGVASVNAGVATGLSAGSASIIATSEGKSDTSVVTVTVVPVASLTLTPPTAAVRVGQPAAFTASTRDSAGNVLTGRVISWMSTAPAVATVSTGGVATGVSPGSASIIATSEGKSDTSVVTVTVVPVASVAVTPATATVVVGLTTPFTATTRDSAGGVLTGRVITWASTAPAVATVGASGVATGVSVGTASIIATSEGQSDTAVVTVTAAPAPVASVTVTPPTATVFVGGTTPFTATTRDSAGTILTGRVVTWISTAPAVATVNVSGVARGVTAGTASIIATSEGKSDTSVVTVLVVPVAAVTVTPASASVQVGQTTTFTATTRDSAGTILTGRVISWASTNTAVATVAGGVTTGVSAGSASIIATSEGKSDTSGVTVVVAPPPGAVPDPTLLPLATGQLLNVTAYNALNVRNQPAGFSYNDPVTGVKIWKVTSSTVPQANSGAGHDYSDGGNRASIGWGPNNNTHTILIRGDGMSYYLVDFTRGVGFSNYRIIPSAAQPARDLCFSFSNLASQPRIAYVFNGGVLKRFNTQTMQVENTGNFPVTVNSDVWLQHDKNDVWFVGLLNGNTTAFAWNSQTGQLLNHSEAWMDEARLERDGRYVIMSNGNSTLRLWDLSTNTLGPTQTNAALAFFHNANLRSQWISVNNNAMAPWAEDRYSVSGGAVVKNQFLIQSAGPDVHYAGNWVQSDAELGGNLNRQWSFVSGYGNYAGVLWRMAVGVQRSDGSDQRLLLHHYSSYSSYFALPWGTPSPDGKVVLFNSDMNGSGRYDLFVAELPLR